MRILLTEADGGDSLAIEHEARLRGHEVVRCQPRGATAIPCLGASDAAQCPFELHVDVVVDVRAEPDSDSGADTGAAVQPGELGMICALRERVPIVVVGANPLGTAAVQTVESEALGVATELARRAGGRPDLEFLERQVARALAGTGTRRQLMWVGYLDRDDGFDVVVETDRALQLAACETVERTLYSLLWQARDDSRLNAIIFEHR